jgi:formyltetrahydrofolate hydrolase
LRCDIAAILSNHADLRPVAEQFGIEFRRSRWLPTIRQRLNSSRRICWPA